MTLPILSSSNKNLNMTQLVSQQSERLIELIRSKFSNQIIGASISLGDLSVDLKRDCVIDFFKLLKIDAELHFDFLLSLTAVDWLDKKAERFEVVYHLLSLPNRFRIRAKVGLSETNPEIASISSLYSAANFLEREVWDMFGIRFQGHPDLRRILMYPEFDGHPLRKDYPVQGKQPRMAMRAPEVHNTARNMQRSPLLQINKRKPEGSYRGASFEEVKYER